MTLNIEKTLLQWRRQNYIGYLFIYLFIYCTWSEWKIPKNQNMIVDEIAKQASLEERPKSMGLEMEVQKCPSIEEVFTFAIQSTSN